MPWRSMRALSKVIVRQKLELTVEGTHFLPSSGPAIYILVALDWVQSRPGRFAMDNACRAAGWPVVLRRDGEHPVDEAEANRLLRRATYDTLDLLAAGRLVVIFPEGYPNIDPGYTPKPDADAFLPFKPGFVRLAALANRRHLDVPIVPAGFSYQHRDGGKVALRFGAPVRVEPGCSEAAIVGDVEASVRRLSMPAVNPI
jgi:hypothetical protein